MTIAQRTGEGGNGDILPQGPYTPSGIILFEGRL